MAFEIFPWNEWVKLLIGGDEAPFFNGLRRAVYGNSFLRGKSAEDLRRDYGDDDVREEIVQEVFLKTLHLWDAAEKRSDGEIAGYVATTIRNAIKDCYRQAQRDRAVFLSSDGGSFDESESANRDTPDLKPTPEAEHEAKRMDEMFVYSIQRWLRLTPLQASILRCHKRFGLGTYSSQELAIIRGVSIKAIEKQVTAISNKIRELVPHNGHLTPGDKLAHDDRVAKTAAKTAGNIPEAKIRM